jgi:hypothetical protein
MKVDGVHVALALPLSCAIFLGGAFRGEVMASIPRQPVTIHYRRLQDATGAFGKRSLEAAIRAAMSHQRDGEKVSAHWKHRAYVVPPGAEDTLLMNLHDDGGDYFFGDLTQYTKGYMQALLEQAPNKSMLTVEQEPPPKGKEYVHSMMYWLAVDSHLLMIQSKSIGSKQLEDYFTWFLKDQTKTIKSSGQVILQAKFDAKDVGGDLKDIREIIIGGTVPAGPVKATRAETVTDVEKYKEIKTHRSFAERTREVLLAIFNNEADVQKLIDSVPQEARLEVDVHIGYRATKRHVSRAPMQEALRNLPEGEITAIGRDGKMTDKDIRLSHPANVIKVGNLLESKDVIRALREAHKYFVDNGKLDVEIET